MTEVLPVMRQRIQEIKQQLEAVEPLQAELALLEEYVAKMKVHAPGEVIVVGELADGTPIHVGAPPPRTRRTREEMTILRKNIVQAISLEPRHSRDIFRQLVDEGIADDVRKDRDMVMRILREEAADDSNAITRSGNKFWIDAPEPEIDPWDSEPF